MKVRIATRTSPLALWQAEHVAGLLKQQQPDLEIEFTKKITTGDKIQDKPLAGVGGKGLFVKEIEHALQDGEADLAVHSLKDVPTALPDGLQLSAFPPRGDARDALVSRRGEPLSDLPKKAVLGTSSLRRAAQLLRRRPDLQIVPIRGNVHTRIRKLDEEDIDATVLAYAGLSRLGMAHVATEVLDPSVCMPAVGQAILGIETRVEDKKIIDLVRTIDDANARTAALMERAFLHRLQGGCEVPIAAHATVDGDRVSMAALVSSLDGFRVVEDRIEGKVAQAATLGVALAEKLLDAGAGTILDGLLSG